MPITDNPLKQFFRQPAIYIRLPSQGRGWPAGSIEMPANGELPVYPMTAIDEITYQTPDALFNGQAVASVVKSCVPNILDPWAIPSIDFDTILVAVRLASYGQNMDIGSTCPSCKEEYDFGLDLTTVLAGLKPANYSEPLETGDLKFYFRPLNYREMNANAQIQFEQQKTIALLGDSEIPETDKVTQLNAMMKNIMDLTVSTLANSIMEVRSKDAIITETDFIQEFLTNCDRNVFNAIKDRIVNLRESSQLKPLKITCPKCRHQYEQAFTLDMSSFFASAS